MTDYCTILLNPKTKVELLAACIQADAAVRAAHEQATATIIAGWLTLIAGAGALAAAVAAYLAATRQVRLSERQDRLLTKAFQSRLLAQITSVEDEIVNTLRGITSDPFILIRYSDAKQLIPLTAALKDRLYNDNWEDLARTGILVVQMEYLGRCLEGLLDQYGLSLRRLVRALKLAPANSVTKENALKSDPEFFAKTQEAILLLEVLRLKLESSLAPPRRRGLKLTFNLAKRLW